MKKRSLVSALLKAISRPKRLKPPPCPICGHPMMGGKFPPFGDEAEEGPRWFCGEGCRFCVDCERFLARDKVCEKCLARAAKESRKAAKSGVGLH